MHRINAAFARRNRQQGKLLAAFCTANFPHAAGFAELLHAMPAAGVDLIEIGMPFSDPIADGPTIQHSNKISLAAHTRLKDIFAVVAEWRKVNSNTALILMGYYNPIMQFGEDAFIDRCCRSGVDGLIVVDLPPEEAGDFFHKADKAGVAVIRLVTPTTTAERMRYLCAGVQQGFSYYVAVSGVTGVKKAGKQRVAERVMALRQASNLPVAVGFGISSPEEARDMAEIADGIVVGSAFIRHIEEGGVAQGLAFVRQLREALDSKA